MKITIDIPDRRISDLLCCAFEGGSGYWMRLGQYVLDKGLSIEDFREGGRFQHDGDDGSKDYHHPSQLVPLVDGCEVEILELDETAKGSRWIDHRLDRDALLRGLSVMQERYGKHFGDLLAEQDDATTGDVFLQCCIFGEAKYG